MKIILFIVTLGIAVFVTTFFFQNTQQADINYYQGQRYFEKGQYDKATAFYKKTLTIDSERLDALIGLAYCYQWTGNHKKAINTFQKALFFKPNDNKLKTALARTYSWEKKYEKAIHIYKEIIETTDSIDAKKRLAEVYIWNKQFDKAVDILERVLENNPKDAQAKLLLAKALQYSGSVKKAIRLYQELLKQEKEGT